MKKRNREKNNNILQHKIKKTSNIALTNNSITNFFPPLKEFRCAESTRIDNKDVL